MDAARPMCTLLFAHDVHPTHRLVVAANRDELHARPTLPLHRWDAPAGIVAGRDQSGGGTWLGVAAGGRWAAITNVREPSIEPVPEDMVRTRGELVADFLAGDTSPLAYLEAVARRDQRYNGFNLVVGDLAGVFYYSNRIAAPERVPPGIHGLSNARLNTPWPKVTRGREALARLVAQRERLAAAPLLDLLADRRGFADADLPDTGVGLAHERRLAPLFIAGDAYGTRSSTALLLDRDLQAEIIELGVLPGSADRPRSALRLDLAGGLRIVGEDPRALP